MINISPYTRGRRVKPDHFLSDRRGPKFGTPEWTEEFSAWVRRHNRRVRESQQVH